MANSDSLYYELESDLMDITITITESNNLLFPPLRRAIFFLMRSLESKYRERELVISQDRSTMPYNIGPYINVIEPETEYTPKITSMNASYKGANYTLDISTFDAITYKLIIRLKTASFLITLLRELRDSGIDFTDEQTTIMITTTIEQLKRKEMLNSIW